jgi:hypothetical protein
MNLHRRFPKVFSCSKVTTLSFQPSTGSVVVGWLRQSRAISNGCKRMGTRAALCIAGRRCFCTLPSLHRRKAAEMLLLARSIYKESVSQWLEQHRAQAQTAAALRKYSIGAECGVRQMLQPA